MFFYFNTYILMIGIVSKIINFYLSFVTLLIEESSF